MDGITRDLSLAGYRSWNKVPGPSGSGRMLSQSFGAGSRFGDHAGSGEARDVEQSLLGGHGDDGQEGAPISRIVAEVARACPGERITLGQMSEAFGDRAFGLLILLMCLPALLPGAAMVFGLPLLLLGSQMGMGRRQPRLPGFLARRSIRRADLLRLADRSSRWLGRVERYVRPRPGRFSGAMGDRLVGWLTVWTAIMLILPGPGTNGPPAFGNIVMALGVVEHDSRVTGWGIALTAAGCLLATAMLLALCWLGWQGLNWML